ncbi:glycosyltransferase [Clostridium sp. D33t1_170424_F3]|uniref:glycosyltransferase family 2 protein n=1 Tax=Clostridium sp. D33t1_170424_F3 TaxID=2787099 RepID=UPI0018A8B803|nr:glycosyltransferase [Clostridium sp. D33t1_170424_F3]
MYKCVFVILHYLNIEETRDCIASLKKCTSVEDIVVVDNASPNGSGKALQTEFIKDQKVHIILNRENSGFAEGNNIGYRYAKQKLGANFIVCINNDTIIDDESFIEKIYTIYQNSKFDVLGPDVFNPISQVHQSPIRGHCMTEADLKFILRNLRKVQVVIYAKQFLSMLHLRSYTNQKDNLNTQKQLSPSSDVVIHGACVIYGPGYIQNENNAFVNGTFMYFEEDLLKLQCVLHDYKMLFDPQIGILHLEGKSTASSVKSNFRKDLFVLKQSKKSLKVCKLMLKRAGLINGEI